MKVSRRTILNGLGAMVTLPIIPLHNATASGTPDVIIIGAGIAGITAARELAKKGVSFTVVEARNRIGGRAYTESETFGVPYDHGCAWLHSANKNPLTALVEGAGFDTRDDEESEIWMYSEGEELDEEGYEEVEDAVHYLERRVDNHDLEERDDKSVRALSSPNDTWGQLAHLMMGEYEAGIGTDKLSVEDAQTQIGTGVEWMVPQGMAAGIFQALGSVPVSLNTIVKKVKWGNKNVVVETNKGTLSAKAVIITVPTDIIADGSIAFEPALPDWKLKAYQDCPMGVLDKTTLQFTPAFNSFFEEADTTTAYINHKGVWQDHLLRPFELPLDIAFTGGDQSYSLAREADPQMAAIDLALSTLIDTFGSDVKSMFVKGHFTNWSAEPFSRGAYAYAKIGKNSSRKKMARPLDNKLFFAGEATVAKWATQAPAAYLSGKKAAKDAIDTVIS